MRKQTRIFMIAVALALAGALLLIEVPTSAPVEASSHREAPLITADPLADNTDVYAFRSTEPGREGYVTLIANYIPFQEPSGGPHFYKFDDSVRYHINIDNTGDGYEDLTLRFEFSTKFTNPDIVLGMAAPNEALQGTGGIEPLITSLNDPDYNEPQYYTVKLKDYNAPDLKTLASGLITPPNNIGERSTPNYEQTLASQAVHTLPNGGRVFAGQRDEGFYIDVGAIFDTLNLRSIGATGGIDSTAGFNVNTIAIELPIQMLTRSGKVPSSPTAPDAVIGVWATAERRTTTIIDRTDNSRRYEGPHVNISRLGNPLVNELVIPLKLKDRFNASSPGNDELFAPFVVDPQLPKLMQAVFGINIPSAPRNDLVAIFATGIPAGAVPGAPNYTTFLTDGRPHEYQRLNVAIPPTPASQRSRLGLLGGDLAGFPNGRRVGDDVVDIALRAMAGGTPFTPATNVAPNNTLGDGVDRNDVPYLDRFPYLGTPHSGNTRAGVPHEHHVIVGP